MGRQGLNRNDTMKFAVIGLKDHSHAAGTNNTLDIVAPKPTKHLWMPGLFQKPKIERFQIVTIEVIAIALPFHASNLR